MWMLAMVVAAGEMGCPEPACAPVGGPCNTAFAAEVVAFNGTFNCPPNSAPTVAARVLGAPDDQFIQLADGSSITVAIDAGATAIGAVRLISFDEIAPAAARVEISADGLAFVEIEAPEGTLWYDSCPSGYVDIPVPAGSDVRFVRVTDHATSIDCDEAMCDDVPGLVGFDLDAIALVASCPADVGGGPGQVGVEDLLALLASWDSDGPGAAIADPCDVADVADLLALIAAWGPCES